MRQHSRFRLTSRSLPLNLGTLLVLTLLACAPAVRAQSTVPFGFKNLEGQVASGLRVELGEVSGCTLEVLQSGAFPNATVERKAVVLSGATIDRRGSVRVLLRTSCSRTPEVQEWWWLDPAGDRLGAKRRPRLGDNDPAISSRFEERSALQVVSFLTPEGQLEVLIPTELQAGDTLSGSLAFEASGEGRQLSKNLGGLRSYSLELSGQDVRLLRETWTLTLPESLPGIVEISLWDVTGELLAANAVPLAENPEASDLFRIPRFTQGGQTFSIRGPFDGDLSNTTVALGEAGASVLAESPRRLVVRAPQRPVGSVEIRITEGETTAVGELRNIDVRVAARQPTITTGERLDLNVEVSGLQGLDQPVRIELVNHTLALAHFLDAGLSPVLVFQPDQVNPNGTANQSLQLEGNQGGAFDIEARLAPGN